MFIRMWAFTLFLASVKDLVEGESVEVKTATEGHVLILQTGATRVNGDGDVTWLFKKPGFTSRIAQITHGKVATDYEDRFTGRLRLDEESVSLTILNISTADSGVYEASLTIRLSFSERKFKVDVYAPVSEPVIERNLSSGTLKQPPELVEICTMSCSVRNDRDVFLSLYKGDELVNQFSSPDLNTSLSLALELHSDDPETYSCTAVNPVSQKSVRLHIKNDCTPQEDCQDHCGFTVIRLVLSSLVGIATVFFLVEHVKFCSSQRGADSSACHESSQDMNFDTEAA